MTLQTLTIRNVRNHAHTALCCSGDVIIFWGANGAGKTTVLEAISMLCTTRSFVTKQDRNLLRIPCEQFDISGEFLSSGGSHHSVSCTYPGAQARREMFFDNAPLESSADLIGRFPLVMLSPQHRPITAGGPAERRSFMDFVISQVHHHYLEDLITYRRIVRQRNALLSKPGVSFHHLIGELEPWNAALAEGAVLVTRQRLAFVQAYTPYLEQAMEAFTGDAELPKAIYRASTDIRFEADDAAQQFLSALKERIDQDIRLKSTGIGPHRDDLEMLLNGMDIRSQASQGQHKTLLIAMKIAELRFVSERIDEVPILLLDDVFSELDDRRLNIIMTTLHALGSQIFITTVNEASWKRFADGIHPMQVFEIADGAVQHDSRVV